LQAFQARRKPCGAEIQSFSCVVEDHAQKSTCLPDIVLCIPKQVSGFMSSTQKTINDQAEFTSQRQVYYRPDQKTCYNKTKGGFPPLLTMKKQMPTFCYSKVRLALLHNFNWNALVAQGIDDQINVIAANGFDFPASVHIEFTQGFPINSHPNLAQIDFGCKTENIHDEFRTVWVGSVIHLAVSFVGDR
jgi:hypothetical protein